MYTILFVGSVRCVEEPDLKDGVLVAVDAVNRAPEFMMAKMLTQKKAVLDPARIRDEAIPVKEIAG